MSNNKQSSVEKMFQEMLGIQQEGIKLTFDENLDLLHKYKAMQKQQAEHYATFITNCVINNLPTITFNDWINLEKQ